MAKDRRTMYNGFSEKGGHSIEWVPIIKDFLNQAFPGGRHVAKCPCKICCNYRFLTQDEVQVHLRKKGFMPNYLVLCGHGEVEPLAIGAESDKNEDEDQMDEMITDIGSEYEVGFVEQAPLPEVHNFYMLLIASDEKVHDDTDVTYWCFLHRQITGSTRSCISSSEVVSRMMHTHICPGLGPSVEVIALCPAI
jgi:hypothetical protein